MITEATIVSSDTLKTEHLIKAFTPWLEQLDPEQASALRVRYQDIYEALPYGDLPEDEAYLESGSDLVSELHGALGGAAGEGFTFGASEGDGACFGFWPVEDEWLQDALLNQAASRLDTEEYQRLGGSSE